MPSQATKSAPPKQRPKPEVVGTEPVVVACGHTLQFDLFSPKQDKYRDQRRAKLIGKPCGPCRTVAHEKHIAEAKAKAASKPKKMPNNPQRRVDLSQRLPHSSVFNVAYDAERVEWRGTLTVNGTTFKGFASGVFALLSYLDFCYRQAVAAVEKTGTVEKSLAIG